MTPSEKKNRKRARILRIAVPVLLACLFAALAVLEKNGVFTAVNRAKTSATEAHPAAVPVPFTGLSVLNRLENEGFSQVEGLLLRNGQEAGLLSCSETDGELNGFTYTLVVLPAGDALAGSVNSEAMKQQSALDRENAHLVFRAVFEALLGGEPPKETQLRQGENKLDSCLSSAKEKTETLSAGSCTVTFRKAFTDGMYTLTMTGKRN